MKLFKKLLIVASLMSAKLVAQPVLPTANAVNLYGKILHATSQKIVEAASVQLFQLKADSISGLQKYTLVGISLTDKKGEFDFPKLNLKASYKIEISAVGYEIYNSDIQFVNNNDPLLQDLGNIKLIPKKGALENVTVQATKPLIEMYLDRKVYNVEKDISASGGTGLDVLRNIPSLNVGIDGNILLRNAAPQIFVDGRPSALTPDQIPSDQIASVEIISNPSAKYDASGGGAGILNIILKKNRKSGYNGNLRAGIDRRGMPSLGGDFNIKKNKINLFSSLQMFKRKSITDVETDRIDEFNNGKVYTVQTNRPTNTGRMMFGRAGIDYFMTNRSTLSVEGNFFRGQFFLKDEVNSKRDSLIPSLRSLEYFSRSLAVDATYKNTGTSMAFKHIFPKAGRELTADVNFNQSKNLNTSLYNTRFFDANYNPKPLVGNEIATGGNNTRFYTLQTDYLTPMGNNQKLETGIRITGRNYDSWNDNFRKNLNTGEYALIPGTQVYYDFKDIVSAAYVTYSQQLKKLSYQLGLRAENSNYEGEMKNTGERFANNFPISLFPSLYLSYKLGPKQDLQLNYSRKINRPGFFQLLPFVDFSDSLNLSSGNPALLPEFTNLAELNYSYQFKPGHSFMATLYAKNTEQLITRFQFKGPNTDISKPDSLLYNTFANADRSYTIGLELIGRNKLKPWWEITSNLNFFDVTLINGNLPNAPNNQMFSWFGKLINNFKLPRNYSIQLSGDYQSKTILPVNSGRTAASNMYAGMVGNTQNLAQGFIKPIYGVDVSVKKDFWKDNKASLTLQFSDVLGSRANQVFATNNFFTQNNYRLRDPYMVRLNFNYRFGKFDASINKRKNTRTETENTSGM